MWLGPPTVGHSVPPVSQTPTQAVDEWSSSPLEVVLGEVLGWELIYLTPCQIPALPDTLVEDLNYSNHRTWSDFPILVPFITFVWHITDTFEPPQLQNQPPTAQKEPFHKGPDKISFSLRSSLTATSLLEGLTTSKVLPSLAGRRLLLRNIPDRISLIASFSGDILLEERVRRNEERTNTYS